MKTTVYSYCVGGHYVLCIDGHSDCNIDGVNPVCACVSVLVTALWYSLPNRYKEYAEIESGFARFDIEANEEDKELVSGLFRGVIEGLRIVAKEYPWYIEITSDILP